MVFLPHWGEISPINMLPHLLSFLKHHPRCRIPGDVDAASNKMSSLLACREFVFALIHIQREGETAGVVLVQYEQTDKWTM